MAEANGIGKRRGVLGREPMAASAKSKAGTFRYRGLELRRTFVKDARFNELFDAMREIGLRTHVLTE